MRHHGHRESLDRPVTLVHRDDTEECTEERDEEKREHAGNFLMDIEIHTIDLMDGRPDRVLLPIQILLLLQKFFDINIHHARWHFRFFFNGNNSIQLFKITVIWKFR